MGSVGTLSANIQCGIRLICMFFTLFKKKGSKKGFHSDAIFFWVWRTSVRCISQRGNSFKAVRMCSCGLPFLALHLPDTNHLSYRSVLAGSHMLKLSHLILIIWRTIFTWSVAIGYTCKFLSSCILCQFDVNVLEADKTAWVKKVKGHFDRQATFFTEMIQTYQLKFCCSGLKSEKYFLKLLYSQSAITIV